MEILFWIAVLTWMLQRSVVDGAYAIRGKPNPRYELKKARAVAAGQAPPRQPRYGGREWFADLTSDALAANTARRRAKAQAQAQPVDDMIDVIREDRNPTDPNNTRNCSTCRGAVVLDGRPCPRCLAEQRRRNAEWEARLGEPGWLTPDRDGLDEPTPVVHDEPAAPSASPERSASPVDALDRMMEGITAARLLRRPPGVSNCDRCGREAHLDDMTPMANGRDEVQFWCDRHETPERPSAEDTPTAQIIPFPNIKKIEMEIIMSNEVTGLSTAVAFAAAAANAHQSFAAAGAEGYVGALERGGNGAAALHSAREAMEASGIAADRWAAHKAVLESQMTVREAYQSQPDAADKGFLLAE